MMRQTGSWLRVGVCVSFSIALASQAAAQGAGAADRSVGEGRLDPTFLQRLLVAEDHRGTGPAGIAPLREGFASKDTLYRRVAIRGLGRLQRPEIGHELASALTDPLPAIRAEAANAIAQSLSRIRQRPPDSGQVDVRWAAAVLTTALVAEKDPTAESAIAESLGRLPFGDSLSARPAEQAIVKRAGTSPSFGDAHGLYWIALARTVTGGLSPDGVALLRRTVAGATDPVIRRVSLLALTAGRAVDSTTIAGAMRDKDEQVRRLAVAAAPQLAPAYRASVVATGFLDQSPIVRIAAVGAERAGQRSVDCQRIVVATNDATPYVAQIAVDGLATLCTDTAAASGALQRAIGSPARPWQVQAHALVSLAHVDAARARPLIRAFAASKSVGPRIYAATAAGSVGDTAILVKLARDPDNNVRESAINALSSLVKHFGDSLYIAALSSKGYQVVLAADTALKGTRDPAALPALLAAFERLSSERRENSRDPRVGTLTRISEIGNQDVAARLMPYLADFDSTVARAVAATLSRWSGTTVTAHPVPLPIADEPLAKVFLDHRTDLRVTMDGGGVFTVRMYNDETPATVARVLRLVRTGYYNGHVFQRVEPNFVVQGGGPDANEYVGDAQFMRDELLWRSELVGTLGISGRGRDTGDAQWYFNLTDNTRLDHLFTLFGEVTSGWNVASALLEGARIQKVEVVKP